MKQKNRLNYVVFIAPTMVLFLLVFAVPVVVLVGSSFCNWRTGDPFGLHGMPNWVMSYCLSSHYMQCSVTPLPSMG